MDGYDDFSVYNDDTTHNMYVDDFYNAGGRYVDNVTPDKDITADEDNPAPLVDDCRNVDVAELLDDCLRRCGYYDD